MWIPPGLTSGPRTQEFKQEQNEQGPGFWQYAQGPLHQSKLRGSNRVVGEKGPENWLTGCHSLEICAQNENGEFIILNLQLFHSPEHTKKDVVSSEVRSHRLHHQPNKVQGGPGNHPQANLYTWSPGSPGEDIQQNPNNPSPRDSELKQKKEN